MAMAQIPQQVTSANRDAVHAFGERQPQWARGLAVGSLITGAILLLQGKRKAGLAVAAAGAAIALLEEPEEINTMWRRVPSYIDSAKRLISRLEGLVEDLSSQGHRLKGLLEKAQG